jgi:hypothetical protein
MMKGKTHNKEEYERNIHMEENSTQTKQPVRNGRLEEDEQEIEGEEIEGEEKENVEEDQSEQKKE